MSLSIEEFRPEWAHYFEQFNRAWIEKYFSIEPADEYTFKNLDEAIFNNGGQIVFTLYKNKVIGCVAILKLSDTLTEISKMAVDEKYLGLGAGKLLCKTAVERSKQMGAKKIQLYTNSSLKPAINIYRNLGFREVPVEAGKYLRADVKMEK